MPAPKGNKYWEFRNKHGRDYEYNPENLWEEAVKYFEWVEANPLWESVTIQRGIKTTDKNGKEKIEYFAKAPKMRAMTISGFCLFADICEKTFANYRENKAFIQVITRIEKTIYSQKFEGAAATLLNPNIIARDLGLSDNVKGTNTNINYNTEVSKEEVKNISDALEEDV